MPAICTVYLASLLVCLCHFIYWRICLQSPFPEERGYVLPLRETQRLNQLSDIKKSLSFSGIETASPAFKSPMVTPLCPPPKVNQTANEQEYYSSSATALKPSDVVELQKHMSPTAAKKQQRGSSVNSRDSTLSSDQRPTFTNQGTLGDNVFGQTILYSQIMFPIVLNWSFTHTYCFLSWWWIQFFTDDSWKSEFPPSSCAICMYTNLQVTRKCFLFSSPIQAAGVIISRPAICLNQEHVGQCGLLDEDGRWLYRLRESRGCQHCLSPWKGIAEHNFTYIIYRVLPRLILLWFWWCFNHIKV